MSDEQVEASFSLLQSKTTRPQLDRHFVHRPRVYDRLTAALSDRVILVSAPAGYGKTTAVNSWLSTRQRPYAWLSLDDEDNDLVPFVTYLAAALRTAYPQMGTVTASILRSASVPSPQRLARNLLADLQDTDSHVVAVLDDFHVIRDARVRDFVRALLERLPPHLTFVILTRSDPPLSLAHLRSRKQLGEVRIEDLRFQGDEVSAFLAEWLGTPIATNVADLLEELTEGWPVGLQMAALSLRGEPDHLAFAQRHARDVLGWHAGEYLLDQVLAKLPDTQRQNMLRLSILDRFCESLGATIVEDAEAGSVVEPLWRDNLFLISLDATGTWYRFHHLLRTLLHTRLRREMGEAEIVALHLRASDWFKDHEMFEPAIRHAMLGGQVAQAAAIVETNLDRALGNDDWHRLERWLSQFAGDPARRPALQIAQAYVLHYQYKHRQMPPLLDAAEHDLISGYPLPEGQRHVYLGHIYTLRSLFHNTMGDAAQSVNSAATALEWFGSSPLPQRDIAEHRYMEGLRKTGHADEALRVAHQRWRQVSAEGGDPWRILLTIGAIQMARADVPAVQAAATRLRLLSEGKNQALRLGWSSIGLGWAAYQADDLDRARIHFKSVLDSRFQVHTRAAIEAYMGLAQTLLAQARPREASAVASELRGFLMDTGLVTLLSSADSLNLEVELKRPDYVPDGLDRNELAGDVKAQVASELWHLPALTAVRLCLRRAGQADLAAALDLLAACRAAAARHHNTRQLIEFGALEALVLAALGDADGALAALRVAVVRGEQGRALRLIVDAGSGLQPTLRELQREGVAPAYVAQLLSAYDDQARRDSLAPEEAVDSESGSLALIPLSADESFKASLTNRERDILQLLARRLTNKEIAASLFISPNTVKRHTVSLYKKLGVDNRRQAVARARTLDLIAD